MPDTSNSYIYGSQVRKNDIQYVIKQTPSDQGTKYSTGSNRIYQLQYVLNGRKNVDGNPVSYASDQATLILKDPAHSGFSFADQYSDSSYNTLR